MFIGYQLVMMVSLSAALLRQAVYGSIRLGAYQNIADNYTRSSMLHCCNSPKWTSRLGKVYSTRTHTINNSAFTLATSELGRPDWFSLFDIGRI